MRCALRWVTPDLMSLIIKVKEKEKEKERGGVRESWGSPFKPQSSWSFQQNASVCGRKKERERVGSEGQVNGDGVTKM